VVEIVLSYIAFKLTDGVPGYNHISIFEEHSLSDETFVSFQSVQSTLIDNVPHNHICVL